MVKVEKKVYEYLSWSNAGPMTNISATVLNGELLVLEFKLNTTNHKISLKNAEQNIQVITQLLEVCIDLSEFAEKGSVPGGEGKKRMIQIREVKSSTFGDNVE